MNNNQPLVSVIMPNHNCLTYLKAAVASVQAQNMTDWELIIADDDSSDGSRQWIETQAKQDPRIRLLPVCVHHPAAARNAAIQVANGKWLAMLDADDVWAYDKLSRQLRHHQQHPEQLLSFTDYRHVNEQGQDLGSCFDYWQLTELQSANGEFRSLNKPLSFLFACNCIGTSTVMVSTEAIWQVGGFDVSLPSAEDWDLWLKLAAIGGVSFCASCDMTYLMRAGSESSKLGARIQALELIYKRHQAKLDDSDKRAKRRAQARIASAKADLAQASHRLGEAVQAKMRSLLLQPNKRQAKELVALLKPQ
ncbi:hypothetical protein GCM10011369_27380 [Neiella marina]|uniref:Glycosyltransferase 2-like domain-containing protein n=1 Tax=Neiella marina TaxID=508461 RepID=A0A8J2U7A4_9GAMM|nr:glycosyltransferase [Neiella marina]GGA83891.1 hypothetical protein GCM10011369_27380 [Neiella marina]